MVAGRTFVVNTVVTAAFVFVGKRRYRIVIVHLSASGLRSAADGSTAATFRSGAIGRYAGLNKSIRNFTNQAAFLIAFNRGAFMQAVCTNNLIMQMRTS